MPEPEPADLQPNPFTFLKKNSMKSLFNFFAITLILLAFTMAPEANAQRSFYSEAHSLDTLTNTESVTFTLSRNLEDQFDYTLNVYDTELSGTATMLAIVEQTACATCTDWVSTDTVTIAATGNYAIQLSGDNFWGYRTRVRFSQTGTGVHKFYAVQMLRRRNTPRFGL